MSWNIIGPLLAVLLIAAGHVLFPLIEKKYHHREQEWVSLAGGIAIAYVFLILLPKIGDYTAAIVRNEVDGWEVMHYRLYAIALLGMLTYYLNNRLNLLHDGRHHLALAIHVALFAFYNFTVGDLLVNIPREGYFPYVLVGAVFALHMLGVDHQLRAVYQKGFDIWIRWVMAFSVLAGWTVGVLFRMETSTLAVLSAFLAGGIIVNVMTEELPQRGKGRTLFFIGGVVLVAVLVAIVRSITRAVSY
ncbi:MAG: hypothetical protein KAI77_00555 [Gammaproteobacteria bacterium]|nr:hypothetical protein [Gammaproteobacteria bacterium]